MSNFAQSQVHVDRPLTDYAIGYSNKAFIGRKILGSVPVSHRSDQYFVRSKREIIQYMDNELPVNGPAQEIQDASLTTASYACRDYGLQERVINSVARNADPALNLRMDATDRVLARVGLADEIRVATLLLTAGNYATANKATLTGSDRWDDASGGDPVGVVATYRSAIWSNPGSKMIGFCGIDVWNKVKTNAKLLDRIKYNGNSLDPARTLKLTSSKRGFLCSCSNDTLSKRRITSSAIELKNATRNLSCKRQMPFVILQYTKN